MLDSREKNSKRAEVLAPAGSIEIAKAVINAGADAVYLGGDMFGARAYAGNLNKDEMLEIIEYAHRYGRKVYLTVNTLLKQREIDSNLIEFLIPYYEKGLDAVIVQDMGVFKLIHEHFPDMDIHASTQMTQTGPMGSKILRELGAARVVTSREMSFEEIRQLHKALPDLEIESFVHGALCYSYSGQCLLSSFNGGRSGNRGRCAQPCRMAYDMIYKGEKVNDNKEKFILSPKDMCGLTILPDIIESGVYSLKIEGRMKNVTYAAYVTSMYRKYLDLYFKKGKKGYKVDEKDLNDLLDIYNRGFFTTGYYNSKKGRDMLSLTRPNHMGTRALKVLSNKAGRVNFLCLEDINPGDVFEIEEGASFTSGKSLKTKESFVVNLPKKYKLYEGRVINRMNNGAIKEYVLNEFVLKAPKLLVDFNLYASVGENLCLSASIKNPNYDNEYYAKESKRENQLEYIDFSLVGDIVEEAKTAATSKESVIKALSQTGDTAFIMGNADIYINGNAFIPVGMIKKIRREILDKLDKMLINCLNREYKALDGFANLSNSGIIENNGHNNNTLLFKNERETKLSLYFTNWDLSRKIKDYSHVSRVYLDFSSLFARASKFKDQEELEKIRQDIKRIKEFKTDIILSLPYVYKISHKETFESLIKLGESLLVDGFLIRSLEELASVDVLVSKEYKVILDSNLYCFNSHAKEEFEKILLKNLKIDGYTAALELNNNELSQVLDKDYELEAYTRAPLMISEQCPKKTFNKCNNLLETYSLVNTKNNEYIIKSVCPFCYMQMESEIINILDTKEILDLDYSHLRIRLENEEDLLILEKHFDAFNNLYGGDNKSTNNENKIVEYGHFYRGVE